LSASELRLPKTSDQYHFTDVVFAQPTAATSLHLRELRGACFPDACSQCEQIQYYAHADATLRHAHYSWPL